MPQPEGQIYAILFASVRPCGQLSYTTKRLFCQVRIDDFEAKSSSKAKIAGWVGGS